VVRYQLEKEKTKAEFAEAQRREAHLGRRPLQEHSEESPCHWERGRPPGEWRALLISEMGIKV